MQGRDNGFSQFFTDNECEDAQKLILDFTAVAYTLQEYINDVEKIMQRYSLDEESAVNFRMLKLAMKEELGHGGKSGLQLIEVSNKFTKERLIEVGNKIGLSETDVIKLLPAMAMKLTASEIKFTLSAFKGGLFSKPQELNEALRDVDNKYTQRFGL